MSDGRQEKADRTSGMLLSLLMLVAFAVVSQQIFRIASGTPPPVPGRPAPDFFGRGLDGSNQSLGMFRGRVVLIDFWATWCPPCLESMPVLEKLYREKKDRGFEVLGVNIEPEDLPRVRQFVRRSKLSFPMMVDTGTIASTYGVFSYPTSFLVNREGTICGIHRGSASEDLLAAEIERMLAAPAGASGC